MRDVETILNVVMKKHSFRSVYGELLTEMVLPAIKEAMREAIIECAANVKMTHIPCGDIKSCGCEGICEHPYFTVNKASILSLIEQVK